MFPAEEAARIAVDTVKKYLDEQETRYSEVSSYIGASHASGSDAYKGIEKVIFNVFSDRDLNIYRSILD